MFHHDPVLDLLLLRMEGELMSMDPVGSLSRRSSTVGIVSLDEVAPCCNKSLLLQVVSSGW